MYTPEVVFKEECWELCGTVDGGEDNMPPNHPESRLLADLIINGNSFHAEAYQVERSELGLLEAVNPSFEDELNAVVSLLGDVEPETQSITIKGVTREYVIVVFPYAE
jgi:hypothetical protein